MEYLDLRALNTVGFICGHMGYLFFESPVCISLGIQHKIL